MQMWFAGISGIADQPDDLSARNFIAHFDSQRSGLEVRVHGEDSVAKIKIHMIAPEVVEAELRKAGFDVDSRRDDIDDNPGMDHTRWAIAAHRGDAPANR